MAARLIKIRLGQHWQCKNNPEAYVVYRKGRGDKWMLLRTTGGGRGKVHSMTDWTINRWYTLIEDDKA